MRRTGRSAPRRASPGWLPKALRLVGRATFAVGGVLSCLLLAVVWYAKDLPPVDDLTGSQAPRILVLDRHGEVLGTHGQDRGEPVDLDTLPKPVSYTHLTLPTIYSV